MHLVTAPAELGQHVLGEHLGVAARDVDVHVAAAEKAVEHAVERGRVVRVPQLFPRNGVLDLVEKDVVGAVATDMLVEVVIEGFGVTKDGIGLVVEGDFNHVVVGDAQLP